MSNLRSPLWRKSYQRSFLFVFQTRHSPVVHVGQRAKLVTHKVGKGGLKFINEKKELVAETGQHARMKEWNQAEITRQTFYQLRIYLHTILVSTAKYFNVFTELILCAMCQLILVKNLADLKLRTEFYLLKLMDIMVNTKQNMMKIRPLSKDTSNCLHCILSIL